MSSSPSLVADFPTTRVVGSSRPMYVLRMHAFRKVRAKLTSCQYTCLHFLNCMFSVPMPASDLCFCCALSSVPDKYHQHKLQRRRT